MILFVLIASALVAVALLIGVAGYHWFAGYTLIDSLLNASMILTGMGQVNELKTAGAKLFASCYALFSGLVFITSIGVVLAPVMHRILHKFHMDEKDVSRD